MSTSLNLTSTAVLLVSQQWFQHYIVNSTFLECGNLPTDTGCASRGLSVTCNMIHHGRLGSAHAAVNHTLAADGCATSTHCAQYYNQPKRHRLHTTTQGLSGTGCRIDDILPLPQDPAWPHVRARQLVCTLVCTTGTASAPQPLLDSIACQCITCRPPADQSALTQPALTCHMTHTQADGGTTSLVLQHT